MHFSHAQWRHAVQRVQALLENVSALLHSFYLNIVKLSIVPTYSFASLMWHNAIGPWGWRLGNILGLGSQRSLFGSWLHSTSGAALQSPYFEAFHLPPTWELWRCWDHLSGCVWWKAPFGIGSLPPSYFLVSLCHICLLPYPNMKFTTASGEKYVLKSHLLLCVQDGGGEGRHATTRLRTRVEVRTAGDCGVDSLLPTLPGFWGLNPDHQAFRAGTFIHGNILKKFFLP